MKRLGLMLVFMLGCSCGTVQQQAPIDPGPPVKIEILDGVTCMLRNSEDGGIVHYFPCELLLNSNAKGILHYIEVCDDFYDNACEGFDI